MGRTMSELTDGNPLLHLINPIMSFSPEHERDPVASQEVITTLEPYVAFP